MTTANLFERAAFEALKENGLTVERRERVVVDKFVTLEGQRFDANDLLETLYAVEGGNVTTSFTREKTEVLKRLGILEYEGNSRWMTSATLGTNAKEFMDMLREGMK